MDKEDNLFEDQIEEIEEDDLLNISLDDLSTDEIEEAVDEEPDEDIIELMDLLEKGDDSLLGIDDDIDTVSEDKMSFDETVETPDIDTASLSDIEPDEILSDSDLSDLDEDLESEQSTEEFDQLLTEDSMDIQDIGTGDADTVGDELEGLLGETEPESGSDDAETLSDEAENLNLEMEDFSDLDAVLDEEGLLDDGISDVLADENNQDGLFEDIDLENDSEDEVIEVDDEILGSSDNEFEKTIVSSEDDVFGEESLWEMDDQDQMRSNELESEDIDGEIALDENQLEAVDDILPDDESVDKLFPDEGLQDEEEIEEESLSVDIPDMFSSEDDQIEITDKGTETQINAETDVEETSVPDDSGPKMDIPAAVPPQLLISEEKIEEIVRSVVGEVVERIAREVFTEVAEKVITRAIDSLKESLE